MTASPLAAPNWRVALNPPIYLVSVLPGLGVPLLAGERLPHAGDLLLATMAVVLLQHAINLYNDAADWRLGADVDKEDSWVRVHGEQPSLAIVHGTLSLLLGGTLGLFVLAQQSQWSILLIGAPLLALGFLYNAGPRPFSYTYLGEWVTGICYGGVFACLWLVAGGSAGWPMTLGTFAFGTLAMALLLSHQPPQIETDRRAGKQSFAVRYGAAQTRRAANVLFSLFVFSIVLGLASGGRHVTAGLLSLFAAALTLRAWQRVPNPKRILSAASLFVIAAWLLDHLV